MLLLIRLCHVCVINSADRERSSAQSSECETVELLSGNNSQGERYRSGCSAGIRHSDVYRVRPCLSGRLPRDGPRGGVDAESSRKPCSAEGQSLASRVRCRNGDRRVCISDDLRRRGKLEGDRWLGHDDFDLQSGLIPRRVFGRDRHVGGSACGWGSRYGTRFGVNTQSRRKCAC